MGAPTPVNLAVDIVVRRGMDVLLIRRKNQPFQGKYALPGGFVDPDETTQQAAVRELREETGITVAMTDLRLVGVYSEPMRDPRSRVVSIAYYVEVPTDTQAVADDDAASVEWVSINDMVEEMAFDHSSILVKAWWNHWPKSWAEREMRRDGYV